MKAYLSQNTDKRIIDSLAAYGIEACALPPHPSLLPPTDTHADMLLFFDGETLFIHKDYEAELSGFLRIVRVGAPIAAVYPLDVPLNIALVGDVVFANTKTASDEILSHLEEKGKKVIHVTQGYAHCSVCQVSDNAIITADKGIYETAKDSKLDALLIGGGNIALPPYEYGFIGGASGTTDSAVYFAGSLSHHPDGERIRAFCEKHGKSAIELADIPLQDIGGILFK